MNRKQRFNTPDEAKTWCSKNNINIQDEFFDNIDIRVFDDAAPVIDEMFAKYPFLKGYDVEFEGDKFRVDFNIGVGDATDGSLLSANGGLKFSPRYFKNYSDGLRECVDQIANGYNVRGDGSMKTFIRHEIGHRVDSYIRSKHKDIFDAKGKLIKGSAEMGVAMDDELRKLASLHGCSEYATTNTYEIFAEGFADYTSGGKSEFAITFGKLLERWLSE